MNNKKKSYIVVAFVCILLCGIIVYDSFFSFIKTDGNNIAMGTIVTYTLTGKEEKNNLAKTDITTKIDFLDKQISRNIKSSEISELNSKLTAQVSDNVLGYINECAKISKLTQGKFDITVGTLSNLWDFDDEKKVVPSVIDIQAATSTVGYEKVKISSNTVTIPKGMGIDLGSVGKGIACDVAMNSMKNSGVKNGVVIVGGSVCSYGKKQVVGVRDPLGNSGETIAKVRFENAVASTSGNYEKYFIKDGVRYHHILDTKSGYPVQNNLVSVTIICESGLASDALSTACFALDYNDSKKVLDEYDAMAVFIYNDKSVKVYNEKYDFKITSEEYERK